MGGGGGGGGGACRQGAKRETRGGDTMLIDARVQVWVFGVGCGRSVFNAGCH
jgi:hypothetical protein